MKHSNRKDSYSRDRSYCNSLILSCLLAFCILILFSLGNALAAVSLFDNDFRTGLGNWTLVYADAVVDPLEGLRFSHFDTFGGVIIEDLPSMPVDISGYPKVSVEVMNPGQTQASLSLKFKAGTEQYTYEFSVAPGENLVYEVEMSDLQTHLNPAAVSYLGNWTLVYADAVVDPLEGLRFSHFDTFGGVIIEDLPSMPVDISGYPKVSVEVMNPGQETASLSLKFKADNQQYTYEFSVAPSENLVYKVEMSDLQTHLNPAAVSYMKLFSNTTGPTQLILRRISLSDKPILLDKSYSAKHYHVNLFDSSFSRIFINGFRYFRTLMASFRGA